jgi:hypothetical protein
MARRAGLAVRADRLRRGLIGRRHRQSAEGTVSPRTSGQINTFDSRILIAQSVVYGFIPLGTALCCCLSGHTDDVLQVRRYAYLPDRLPRPRRRSRSRCEACRDLDRTDPGRCLKMRNPPRDNSAPGPVGGPSVRSGAAERPKSTVGVDLHICFAVDHVQDQPVRPDDEQNSSTGRPTATRATNPRMT